jgi:hypothetical protein
MAHKAFMAKLLQVRAHMILCFRAEQKIEIVKVDGKLQIVPKQSLTGLDGWIPVTEKNVPFELTASFLLTADAPGYPKPIKLQEQHRHLFPLDKPIDENSGKRIAEWASGGKTGHSSALIDALEAIEKIKGQKGKAAVETMIAWLRYDEQKIAIEALGKRIEVLKGPQPATPAPAAMDDEREPGVEG